MAWIQRDDGEDVGLIVSSYIPYVHEGDLQQGPGAVGICQL